jgi:hypothetical protein
MFFSNSLNLCQLHVYIIICIWIQSIIIHIYNYTINKLLLLLLSSSIIMFTSYCPILPYNQVLVIINSIINNIDIIKYVNLLYVTFSQENSNVYFLFKFIFYN